MKDKIKEFLPYVIIILVVVLIRTFIITPVRVQQDSMKDTLLSGDYVILNKLNKNNIKRNDVIVFESKSALLGKNERLIKRVLALPGEKIKCVSGIIYINNEEYEDTYAKGRTDDFPEYSLMDDEYFAVGDNREVSLDSRAFGPIKKKDIQGTTNLLIFPFTRFKTF